MKTGSQAATATAPADGNGAPAPEVWASKSATPRRSRKVSELIAREIIQDILRSNLKPGDMLDAEADMISAYQVGRATLREALRLLEVQGVITVKPGPGGGPVVAQLTPRQFADMAKLHLQMAGATYRELVRARLAIEPLMARLAAENQDATGLKKLHGVVEAARATPLDSDDSYAAMSQAFHATVAGISGNRVLDLLAESLKELMDSKFRAALSPLESRVEVQKAHEAVAAAITNGRGAKAEDLMRAHMEDYVALVERQRPGTLDDKIEWD